MEQRKSPIFNEKDYRKSQASEEYAPEYYKKETWIWSL